MYGWASWCDLSWDTNCGPVKNHNNKQVLCSWQYSLRETFPFKREKWKGKNCYQFQAVLKSRLHYVSKPENNPLQLSTLPLSHPFSWKVACVYSWGFYQPVFLSVQLGCLIALFYFVLFLFPFSPVDSVPAGIKFSRTLWICCICYRDSSDESTTR